MILVDMPFEVNTFLEKGHIVLWQCSSSYFIVIILQALRFSDFCGQNSSQGGLFQLHLIKFSQVIDIVLYIICFSIWPMIVLDGFSCLLLFQKLVFVHRMLWVKPKDTQKMVQVLGISVKESFIKKEYSQCNAILFRPEVNFSDDIIIVIILVIYNLLSDFLTLG